MKIIAGVAVLLLLPMAAFAQGNPGPFGGLFGRTPERLGRTERLFELRTVTTGQYEGALNDASEEVQRSSALANAGLMGLFEQHSTRLDLRARSHASYLQYFQQPYNGGTSVDSAATVAFRVATRLTLDAAVSHLYTPYFQFHPTFYSFGPGGALVPPATPYVATAVESNSYGALGGFSIPYSKRSTIGASFERRETRFRQHPQSDMSLTGMRGSWTRQLNRGWQLRLGYGRDQMELHAGDDRLNETIDVGLNYQRPMAPGRRTTFSVHTETARYHTSEFGRHYRFNGGVNVQRWFERTWMLDLYVQRSTEFVAGYLEPLLADTVGARLSGQVSRRAELSLQVDGGHGQFGFDPGVGRATKATSLAQFSFAVSRKIGVFVQHAAYYYESPESASPIAPVASLARQTFTFGMTTWIPIYSRERAPSDTR